MFRNMDETPLQKVERLLGRYKLASLCGCTYSAVQQWTENGVPAKHALKIEAATDGQVTRYELCPKVFGKPPVKARKEARA